MKTTTAQPAPGVAAAQSGAKDYGKNAATGDHRLLYADGVRTSSLAGTTSPPPPPEAAGGFSWGDAGVGAGAGFVLALAATACVLTIRRRLLKGGAMLGLILAVGLVGAAFSAPSALSATRHSEPTVSPFAAGLSNPRHIRFGPDGFLYVAEAGIGGDQPATTCPPVDNMFTQDGPYLAGFTGRISRIRLDGARETVADRLPSTHDGLGDGFGPSDIAWIGHTMYAVIEGGGCSRGLPGDPAGIVRIGRDGSYRYVADISAFIRANPVANEPLCGLLGDCEPDGVPHSLLAVGDKLYVVETNHNSILRVEPRTGAIRRLYDLSVQDPAPIVLTRLGSRFFLGGFDGLIQTFDHRLGPVATFDQGYGPIVEMSFVRDRLYVLETFALDAPFTPNTGRIIRRDRNGSRTVIASGLNFPIGMARGGRRYRDGLYVSTVSYGQGTVEGLGRIVRVRLKGRHGE